MKATAIAPSNIAFIKYWGVKDEILRLPKNGSISMNLSNMLTTTTVEFSPEFTEDLITLNETQETGEKSRIIEHLDRIRKLAKIADKARVVTQNNFPTATGLSSSASGFAALSVAGAKAAGLSLSEKELSILARQGSGSACRSIPDGFTEWLDGDSSNTSYAVSLYPPEHWGLADVVAVVSKEKKEISSTEGHKLAASSAFFETRLALNKEKMLAIKRYLQEKNFTAFGELVEAEALELHAIYITSHPSLLYLLPGTLRIMHAVKVWRKEALAVYFTLNTGQDIHLICQNKDAEIVAKKLAAIDDVQRIIINHPSKGAWLTDDHLF